MRAKLPEVRIMTVDETRDVRPWTTCERNVWMDGRYELCQSTKKHARMIRTRHAQYTKTNRFDRCRAIVLIGGKLWGLAPNTRSRWKSYFALWDYSDNNTVLFHICVATKSEMRTPDETNGRRRSDDDLTKRAKTIPSRTLLQTSSANVLLLRRRRRRRRQRQWLLLDDVHIHTQDDKVI